MREAMRHFDPEPQDPLAGLVARLARGDQDALSRLYDAASSRVYGLVLRIVRDRSMADETTLDTFAQIWRQAGMYDPRKGAVMGWVLTVARSRAIDAVRLRSRRAGREEGLDEVVQLADASPAADEVLGTDERARRVRDALAMLPPEQRRAIQAAYFSGLSHSEAALELGEPLGTVKTRIRAGLATLRKSLGATGEDWR